MQSKVNAYLSFESNAREAMEFYKSVFGGKLTVSTFKDFGDTHHPGSENLIMHSMLEAENGTIEKLAQGGTVKMPLAQAPWGDSFGMLTDRFGIDWMVNIAGKKG